MIYDLIVVGSGSVGAATGWYATRAGLNVLMTDSGHPPHDQGSHHGETRLIRHAYGEGEAYVPMVLRAQQLWDELEQLAGEKIMHRCGIINLAPATSPFIRNVIDSAQRFALPVSVLTPEQVTARWPQLQVPENYVGVVEAHSGYLRCDVAIRHWIRLAREAGCAQLFNCPVSRVRREGDLQVVTTADGDYRARKVLFSAGTWVTRLLPTLPVTPVRKVFAWHQADGRYSEHNQFPAFTVEMPNGEHYYGFPADNNALKVGKHDGGQPITDPSQRTPFGSVAADGSELFQFLRQFLPGVGVCLHGQACTYDNTADEHFIIDTLPDDADRLIISGLSGHGFKFASVLGEIATAFASNAPPPFDLAAFSLARFER
ncbi:N-methyl-L-tryptophan oxidase [Pantoea sp. 1.19]|uniref:N-methyl-L-tryptophan oxidase n=1 Tax=Pantoea sp. 1.19 TaxID=1925589 RepID=UPI00094898A2|nr:N-methyl-L-tryptophan oxidase [Pantoea sp. 1.19]